jgi:hypothetical protein
MIRALNFLFASLSAEQLLTAQTNSSQFLSKKFPCDTVIHIIDDITRELSLKHPGFYNKKRRKIIDYIYCSGLHVSMSKRGWYQKVNTG